MLPAVTQLGWAAAVAVVGIVSTLLGDHAFHPSACRRFEPYLNEHLVGQQPSIRVLTDAICDFLDPESAVPREDGAPLVVSLHGPPGVGKTYFHKLAARALYNKDLQESHSHSYSYSSSGVQGRGCPGRACPGYKVVFGMDYTTHDREVQHELLQKSLLDHIAVYPQSLIVIEEYDKLDCHMRGFFRQMLQGNTVGNQSLGASIVVLESNLGYSVLHELLENGGRKGRRRTRDEVPMHDAQKALKDMVFTVWQEQGCEAFSDSQKLLRRVDHFVPFYPLEREHIVELFHKKLKGFALAAEPVAGLACDTRCVEEVVPFLLDKVEFDGAYPIEGGKEVNTVSTGYLSRPFRQWMDGVRAGDTGDAHAGFAWRLVDGRVTILPAT
jgi:ATP-dependent Clp protease ATP-binding subunit ClpA